MSVDIHSTAGMMGCVCALSCYLWPSWVFDQELCAHYFFHLMI